MPFLEHFFKTAFTNPLSHPEPILRALGDMREQAREITSLSPSCRLAEKLCGEFREEFPETSISISASMPWYEGASINIPIDDFKKLISIRRRVRQLGFREPDIRDHPTLRQRTWVYSKKGMRITIEGQLRWDDNAACKFVQVGTKEEPVYELRCGKLNGEEEGATK